MSWKGGEMICWEDESSCSSGRGWEGPRPECVLALRCVVFGPATLSSHPLKHGPAGASGVY